MSKLLRNMLFVGLTRGAGPGDAEEEVVGTGNDARVALLNSIGDSTDAVRASEMADVNDDGSTSQFTVPSVEEDPEAAAAREAEQAETDRLAAAVEAAARVDNVPEKIIRKINGVDVEITDELLAKAQKVGSGDVYLAEAKRLRDEAAAGAKPAEAAEVADTDLASIARAIQMGTEEEAVAALQKLQTKAPSLDEFSRKVDDRLTFNQAFNQFTTDYKDIFDDPILKKLAFDADAALLAQGDTRSYADRFTAIGEHLRGWVGSKRGAEVVVVQDATKLERKASAPQAPKPAQGKHVSSVEDEQEESTSDVIAKMAVKRGGPQWMNGLNS